MWVKVNKPYRYNLDTVSPQSVKSLDERTRRHNLNDDDLDA